MGLLGYAVDWSATGSMLQGIGTLVGTGAVIFATVKGADTFKAWRKQKHHERCMVVAEEVLTLAYKVRRAYESIRSPAMFEWEKEQVQCKLREVGMIDENTPYGEIAILSTAQAVLSRTENHKALFEALLDKMAVSKAVFGDDVAGWLNLLWITRAKIITAANKYARFSKEKRYRNEEQADADLRRREEAEGVFWEGGGPDGDDKVANAIDDAISKLEGNLLPIIRNKD